MTIRIIEFRIDDCVYKARPMAAFDQLAVLKRGGPLLAGGFAEIVPFLIKLRTVGITGLGNMALTDGVAAATALARELAKMPDVDLRFVITSCLSLCERKRDGDEHWAPIWNAEAGMAMFPDINEDAILMSQIALGVLGGTFRRFFPEGLSPLFAALRERASKSST